MAIFLISAPRFVLKTRYIARSSRGATRLHTWTNFIYSIHCVSTNGVET